jgi:hypothetical protein
MGIILPHGWITGENDGTKILTAEHAENAEFFLFSLCEFSGLCGE